MSFSLYDEAVANKINNWMPKPSADTKGITVLSPEDVNRILSIEADKNNDKPLGLPFIAISRDSTTSVLNPRMSPLSRDGMIIGGSEEEKLVLRGIPISLTYQIDIYAQRYKEAEELVRELFFKLVNNTQLVIHLPYQGTNYEQRCQIQMRNEIEDTSDIPQRLFPGQFTRFTIRFDILGAYLYDIPVLPVIEIGEVGVKAVEKKEN